MPKKDPSIKPNPTPHPEIRPEADPSSMPAIPLLPEEESDIIPDEDLFETPLYEEPEPGEGP
ncbi:MAG: hypothetical protein IPK31_22030 [Chitinophagaceae bacterium]|nr:hypothetical protein [Chitinophagaceae bacterium]